MAETEKLSYILSMRIGHALLPNTKCVTPDQFKKIHYITQMLEEAGIDLLQEATKKRGKLQKNILQNAISYCKRFLRIDELIDRKDVINFLPKN